MIKSLSTKPVKDNEQAIRDLWQQENLFDKFTTEREGAKPFIFYEGPPTANGRPGIHHVIARTLKDSVCRYKTMQGYQVKRKAGWDTHGLPVEIEVEKQLGLNDKTEIEQYGIEAFNKKCRESVFTYEGMWRNMTERMAYAIDMDNPYITLDNNYIETEWWILKSFFDAGLIYDGHKILPYCTRCGTGLASHEVAQGYKEISVNTVFVKFKKADEDAYFLVWTTTPWTLASNVALTVNPNETYVKVKFKDTVYYVQKQLASKVLQSEDYEVLAEMTGKDMEYWEYEQLMLFCKTAKRAFFVTCADYVTTDDGTGIVHTAPAFGADDYNTGMRYELPVLQPVNDKGEYTETPWAGKFVMDADPDIITWLIENGKLFRKEKMVHNYPHCWRCGTPLLYYAKPSWYIKTTAMRDQLVANNNTVEWYPPFVGEKRFGNWLENSVDWALSRSRYWGTPLNIWRCECGHLESIGSRAELVEKAIEDIDETIELHRPYVDNVHIKCPHCGKTMSRVPDVCDCWFDSGAMPFAQWHYPFENKEDFFETKFPADFICEGIDQTRGWFNSLLNISTFITGKSPYKRVLVNDLMLDKHGHKMHKSKGNSVDPFEMFDKYGADAVRWYILSVSPAWTPTRFDEDGLKEVVSKCFLTLKNCFNFFTLYAGVDNVDPASFKVDYENRPMLDKWIVSRFNSLTEEVTGYMEQYDHMKSVRAIQNFIAEDLSNWYIRRSRRRFWASDLDVDKQSVYATTYEILGDLAKIMAPFAPYISEEMYRALGHDTSVHLAQFPVCNQALVDATLEAKMDLARNLVSLGRSARESAKIKVRQPLYHIYIASKHRDLLGDLDATVREELNVKELVYADKLGDYMNFMIKPNFKVAGPELGSNIKLFAAALSKLDAAEAAMAIEAGESIQLDIAGIPYYAKAENTDIRISAKEGYNVMVDGNLFVILDTQLDDALISEGYAREFISKVQQIRKNLDLDMMDNINIKYSCDDALADALCKHAEYICSETLCVNISRENNDGDESDLNGSMCRISVAKV